MKKTDRYLFLSQIPPLFTAFLFFSSVFLIDRISYFVYLKTSYHVPISTVMPLLLFAIVVSMPMTIPVSLLFSTLYTYSRLENLQEITAMRSLGISFLRLSLPPLLLSLTVFSAAFFLTHEVVPRTRKISSEIKRKILISNPALALEERVFTEIPGQNAMISAADIDISKNRLNSVFIVENGDMRKITIAKNGSIRYYTRYTSNVSRPPENFLAAREKNMKKTVRQTPPHPAPLRRPNAASSSKKIQTIIEYTLFDGQTIEIGENTLNEIRLSKFNTSTITGKGNAYNITSKDNRLEMTSPVLREEIRKEIKKATKEKSNHKRLINLKKTLYRRTAMPFAGIIFFFLALPIASGYVRGGKAGSFVFSIMIIFLYYGIMLTADMLTSRGTLLPWFGTWFANLIFIPPAVILFIKKAKE